MKIDLDVLHFFREEIEKAAQAKTVGGGLLSLAGRPSLAQKYNNMASPRILRLLKKTRGVLSTPVPGTQGIHLPGRLSDKGGRLSKLLTPDSLAHPETAAQILVPGSPIHMPLTSLFKKKLPGVAA